MQSEEACSIFLSHRKETFSQFQAIDFEEFFILVYETWRQLRQGEYLQQVILDVVAVFYDYFAEVEREFGTGGTIK